MTLNFRLFYGLFTSTSSTESSRMIEDFFLTFLTYQALNYLRYFLGTCGPGQHNPRRFQTVHRSETKFQIFFPIIRRGLWSGQGRNYGRLNGPTPDTGRQNCMLFDAWGGAQGTCNYCFSKSKLFFRPSRRHLNV